MVGLRAGNATKVSLSSIQNWTVSLFRKTLPHTWSGQKNNQFPKKFHWNAEAQPSERIREEVCFWPLRRSGKNKSFDCSGRQTSFHPMLYPSLLNQEQAKRCVSVFQASSTQEACANSNANPLMLLPSCVNTPIDNNRSHLLALRVCVLCELGQESMLITPSFGPQKFGVKDCLKMLETTLVPPGFRLCHGTQNASFVALWSHGFFVQKSDWRFDG